MRLTVLFIVAAGALLSACQEPEVRAEKKARAWGNIDVVDYDLSKRERHDYDFKAMSDKDLLGWYEDRWERIYRHVSPVFGVRRERKNFLTEQRAFEIMSELFAEKGVNLRRGYRIKGFGVTAVLDGFDPEKGIGYEFRTEADTVAAINDYEGVGWEQAGGDGLTLAEIYRLHELFERRIIFIFVFDGNDIGYVIDELGDKSPTSLRARKFEQKANEDRLIKAGKRALNELGAIRAIPARYFMQDDYFSQIHFNARRKPDTAPPDGKTGTSRHITVDD